MLTPAPDFLARTAPLDLAGAIAAAELGDDLVAIIIAISDERDQWEHVALDSSRAGYLAGHVDGYRDRMITDDREFAGKTCMPVADGPAYADLAVKRWELRGEPRTRETFGQPHPQDRQL